MIREILVLILVSILLAGCISQPAEKGTLQLTSSPAGAEIYLDNQYRGTTPSTLSGVEYGNHTLEFRSKGFTSWKAAITVPSGTSHYFAALSAQPAEPGTDRSPTATAAPVAVTVRVSRDQMIVGDANTFSGTATGTSSVILTLFGPGYYADGIVLDQLKPGTADEWSYTWNPGAAIQSGIYTVVVSDAGKTVSDRIQFTVIGDGIVTVSPSSYAIDRGESLTLSGRCSTGAPSVNLVLFGPDRFSSGVDLGTYSVMADETWSFRFTADSTIPTGIYTIYVSDVPKTTSGSSQFTIGYAS
jgi:PEGA domain